MEADETTQPQDQKEFNKDRCCIKCHSVSLQNENLTNVSKGIQKLVEYSIKINDTELTKYLKEKQNRKESVRIHRQCQKEVYNELKRKNPIPDTLSAKVAKVSTRSSVGSEFAWKSDCFFCQKSCLFDPKHFGRSDCHHVTTLPLKTKILDVCSKRKDEWAISVQRRVLDCHDLIAAEARYHESCYRNFVLGRASRDETHHQSTAGRPADENCLYFFDQVCEWLEKEGELRSLEEIYVEMVEVAGSAEKVYSKRWLKRKLKEKYQDHIFFSEINGKNDIVCFQNMVGYLVNDKWFLDRKKDIKEEAERIVLTAAKIILNDIRSSDVDNQWYPTNEVIEDCKKEKEWLPTHLRLMLESIIKYPVKQASIGQAIVGAIRPRSSMPPIMFGLGVQLDHVFGSKWLLSQLNRLGFCASSHSVNCYKQAVVQNEDVSDIISNYIPGSFTQWSADNVDHNVRSLDGHGTLHAMGIVASTTSSNNNHALLMSKIARQIQKVGNVIKGKGIPIIQYISPEISGLSKINFKPLLQLQQPYVLPFGTSLDLLWHLSIFFSKSSRPNWSGYMSNASAGSYPGKSTISILPIIDLDPTNLSCIFSTLRFIEEQANIINIPTPVVTFDQPLWLKATEIVSAKSMNIVLVLGGFHLMMSFLGSIGTVMNGSGLSDALQSIYAPKAVEHMMSGKAVSRALRGHFLLASALMTQLLDQCFPELSNDQERIDDPFQESDDDSLIHQESNEEPVVIKSILNECEVDQIESLCKNVLEGGAECVELVNSSEEIYKLRTIFEEYKEKLIKSSRTAKLWIQYLEYINILQLFIRAERTGNWNLHLVSIGKMINLFAATAHINYAKSSRLHLQTMLDLSATHPWVYENFAAKGFHTVRRSDRFWAGLWTDLIIEQVMMRAIKSRGGLTRGRGVSENVRVMWINSMHRCASVHSAMCSLTGLQHKTSEQHIELGVSRVRRDNDDLRKLQNWLRIHNPFDKNETALKSISTGLIVGNGMDVNCDEAEKVGQSIQEKLDGVCVEDATMKRKDRVTTLAILRPGIKIDAETVYIDPTILFTRLTAIAQTEEEVCRQFYFELTPEPTALFKDNFMRKSSKAVLRNHLLDMIDPEEIVDTTTCVIDGDALLHKVKWLPKSTYADIIDSYLQFLRSRYKKYSVVCIVFDGYTDTQSNKAEEQSRRCSTKMSADIKFSEQTDVTTTREMFLRNARNKECFINLLTNYLRRAEFVVVQSVGDADVLIVQKSIEYASESSVVTCADDTDILVLLAYHCCDKLNDMYFSTETRKGSTAKSTKFWSVNKLVELLPHKEFLLFAHAWSGCDSTSATHLKGKTKILLQLESENFRSLAGTFGDLEKTQEEVGNVGIQLFISSYGGEKDTVLEELRYRKFMEMVTTRSGIHPEKLPPTERASFFHALRVNLQVCQWKYLDLHILPAVQWGWTVRNNIMTPVKTDIDPAPEWLLNYIRCKCKQTSKNPCATQSCSCRKNGLCCVQACSGCHGESCNNQSELQGDSDSGSGEDSDFDRNIFDIFE